MEILVKKKFWSKIEILVKMKILFKNGNLCHESKFYSNMTLYKKTILVKKSTFW
mgnify:CR=1 FL=1